MSRFAYDSDEDAKWITIHPNGSEKGVHVKVSPGGEIVAGNPHLVAALNKKNDKEGGAEGNAPESESDIPDDFGDFTPPSDDVFGDDLFADDDPPTGDDVDLSPVNVGKFSIHGKTYQVGTGTKIPAELYTALEHEISSGGNTTDKSCIPMSWSGIQSGIDKVSALLGDNHPYVKALGERKAYVEKVRSVQPVFDIEDEASKVSPNEAEAKVGSLTAGVIMEKGNLPGFLKYDKDFLLGSKKEKGKTIRYVSVALDVLRKRYPHAQIVDLLHKAKVYPVKPAGGKVSGMYALYGDGVIALDTSFNGLHGFEQWRNSHPFALGPSQGGVAPSVRSYYPKGWETYSTFWHEAAHHVYRNYSTKYAENPKWTKAALEAVSQYGFSAKNLSSYACKNKNEYHSEAVALMASPFYIQGSMPEPIERYVYEEVFGCAKDSWKKNESTWKKKW